MPMRTRSSGPVAATAAVPAGRRRRRGEVSARLRQRIERAFNTPGHEVAFSTPARVARFFNVSVSAAKRVLEGLDGYTLHREYKRPPKYNPYFVHSRRELFQADLIDVSKLHAQNDGVRFLLLFIDVMTRRIWVYPLKTKTAAAMAAAFSRLFRDLDRLPQKLQTDLGTEFTAGRVQALLRRRGVEWQSAQGTLKAAYAERANKTLQILLYKYLTENETLRYIDHLGGFVQTYMKRAHRGLKGMKPIDADRAGNERRVQALHTEKYARLDRERRAPRFKVGDVVRVKTDPKKISSSSRAYAEQFHGEYYAITRINRTMPVPMYYLRSLDTGAHIGEGFYAQELQRQSSDVYKIDRIVRRRVRRGRRECLVRWKFFGPRHDSWIAEADIVRRY